MSQVPPGVVELLVPAQLDHFTLISSIGELIPHVREPDRTLSCRLYDSFDWRLFSAGASLEWRFDEAVTAPGAGLPIGQVRSATPILCWRDLRAPNAAPIQQPQGSEPGLLAEMPLGPVRERMAGVLGVRRLLPMVDLISQQTPMRLLNEDDKTVVRLLIEQHRFLEPNSGRSGTLASRLRLQPVRGYPKAFKQVRSLLQQRLGLSMLAEPLTVAALRAAGHRPGDYSTRLDQKIDPAQRADLATKQILRRLLETLEANIEGASQNLDSEFLHDLRVATRRTRSVLSQIKDVFPAALVADFKSRFAWLQQVTGPVRDLDVYLLDFPAMQRHLPPPLGRDLGLLHEPLVQQHAEAQQRLARELGSPQLVDLLRDWRRFLEAPVPAVAAPGLDSSQRLEILVAHSGLDQDELAVEPPPLPPSCSNDDRAPQRLAAEHEAADIITARERQLALPAQAGLPIKQVVDRRLRKLLKRVRAEGRAISADSPPEALHELRKSCKKLRYVMELFQSLYPKDRIREQIKQTKLLLDNLGRFQDTAVQAAHLREQAEASADVDGNGLPPRTLLAMGALIGQLLNDQARARASFDEVFAAFDSAENAERFKALLAHRVGDRVSMGSPREATGDANSAAKPGSGRQSEVAHPGRAAVTSAASAESDPSLARAER